MFLVNRKNSAWVEELIVTPHKILDTSLGLAPVLVEEIFAIIREIYS